MESPTGHGRARMVSGPGADFRHSEEIGFRRNVALSVASKPIFTFRFRVPRFKVPRFQVPRWGREIVEVQGSEVPGSAAGAVRLWEVPRFQGSRFHVSGGNMRGVN